MGFCITLAVFVGCLIMSQWLAPAEARAEDAIKKAERCLSDETPMRRKIHDMIREESLR